MAEEIDVEDDLGIDDGIDELDEMPNLFWHMDVTTNGEDIEAPEVPGWVIHITNACFGANVKSGSRTVVLAQDKDGKESPICVLLEGKNENVRLDLLFSEPAKLVIKGKNTSTVSLTGYLQPPPGFGDETPSMIGDDEGSIDIEDEAEEEQQIKDLMRKRKLSQAQKEAEEDKIPELIEEETLTEASEPQLKRAKLEKGKNNKQQQQEQKKQQQQQQQQEQKKQQQEQKQQEQKQQPKKKQNQPKNANAQKKETETPKESDENQSEKKETPEKKETTTTTLITTTTTTTSEKKEATPAASNKKDQMVNIKGGIQYKDLKPGTGEVIQAGKKAEIYYVGQLDDKKIFDKVISGQGFSFDFGKSAVVKGLDMGMKGMKVGGKRRIVIPAKLGYGEKGTDAVPPNSVLTYTVELKTLQ